VTPLLATQQDALSLPAVSAALGVPRATAYRWQRPAVPLCTSVRRPSPRALTAGEQTVVLTQLHSARFVDCAPAQVYATLLEEDTYLCSTRTMYRILAAYHQVHERRAQRTHPVYPVPRLMATQPNAVWTWDITELKGLRKGDHYKLYVVLDLYSRYVVGWMLASRESVALAQRLITTACRRHGIGRAQLTVHSDRGSVQTAKDWHALYEDLGIVRSLSRPRVSNDNPHSEALFKTTKYAPTFPGRFANFAHAERWCRGFFQNYNHEHRHSGLAYCTPSIVFHGHAPTHLAQRDVTMRAAYQQHPERFVHGAPKPTTLPKAVYINRAEAHTLVVTQ
jgi:putative transposase